MTLEEIATDVWELLGEPTDLIFKDDDELLSTSSKGWLRLMRAARTAQVAISKWRNPRTGKRFRYYGMSQVFTLQVLPAVEGEITFVGNEGINLGVTNVLETNAHSTWYFKHIYTENNEQVSQYGRIISSGDAQVTLYDSLPREPEVGDSYALIPPFIELPQSNIGVMRLVYLNDSKEIPIARPESIAFDSSATLGAPSFYYQIYDRIYIDRIPEEDGVFYVEAERYPKFNVEPDEEPDLPESVHYAIVLHMAGWGFGRYLNAEMRKSMREEYLEYMSTIQLPKDLELDRHDDAFGIKKE
jgi:hypothetical protein